MASVAFDPFVRGDSGKAAGLNEGTGLVSWCEKRFRKSRELMSGPLV
jgi:hypothetical protein